MNLFKYDIELMWACYFVLCSIESSASNISASINSIRMLNDTNLKASQENITIILSVMDLDLALRVERSADLKDKSSSNDKRDMERWDRLNRMSLMIMKRAILEAFKGIMSEKVTTVKGF